MEIGSLGRGVAIATLLGFAWITPATAQQALLTRAEVYKLVNKVQLLLNDRPPRPAKLSDIMAPQDSLRTATRSRAELLFNEGSVARIGANAIFRFIPGMRGFQLRNGTALIMSRPTTVATRIETLEGQAVAEIPPTSPDVAPPVGTPPIAPAQTPDVRSLAMIIQVDGPSKKVNFFNMTNIPIKVLDSRGNSVLLSAGQTVTFLNGTLGPVQTFDLGRFYQTSGLAAGLGPGQESLILQEPPQVQQTLKTVRVATLAALALQTRSLEGLCTLNARGGASTLANNCITTQSDDPLRGYLDRREVVTPDRPQLPVSQPPAIEVPPTLPPNNPPTDIPTQVPTDIPTSNPPVTETPRGNGTIAIPVLVEGQGNQPPAPSPNPVIR